MFGSLYLGALAMAALLGAVQWLGGDTALDPPKTTIARVAWASFFAGVGGVGVLGFTLLGTSPLMTAFAVGVVFATIAGAITHSRVSHRSPQSTDEEEEDEDELPEEHTIEVDASADSAEPT